MYLYTFDYAEQHDGKKNVLIEDACAIWPSLLNNKCNFLDKWCAFVTKRKENKTLIVIVRDLWNMLYEFIENCNGKLEAAEDDGCWPVLIEEFCYEEKVWK